MGNDKPKTSTADGQSALNGFVIFQGGHDERY